MSGVEANKANVAPETSSIVPSEGKEVRCAAPSKSREGKDVRDATSTLTKDDPTTLPSQLDPSKLGCTPQPRIIWDPPRCLADNCAQDLSYSKRYNRINGVCEVHSKARIVLVGSLPHRFCAQCSRFHEISEFEENKRSCRKCLVDYNERRRKSSMRYNSQLQPYTRFSRHQLRQMFAIAFGNSYAQKEVTADSSGEVVQGVPSWEFYSLLYCSVFPNEYEIDKDTLVQLYMAANFTTDECCDDFYAKHFQLLEHQLKIISISRDDLSSGKLWYKINYFSSSEDIPSGIRKATPSDLVTVGNSSNFNLEDLKKLSEMKMLMFLRGHGKCFKTVPYDFFILLKKLVILDLSGIHLSELPSSIGNVKCLHFLDLSDNPIKQLPETLCYLHRLQTLKLRNCTNLIALPRGMRKLTCLIHLEFDAPSRLCGMPPGLGALTNLRTLTEFPVGEEDCCSVQELKDMNKLSGWFCLSKLQNVASLDEVREAKLCDKQWLKRLDLRWSIKRKPNFKLDDEVIEYLQPHTNLKSLRILCYGGSILPSWISNPRFVNLVNITLFKCDNCEVLPSLGLLPSLEFLSLYELSSLKVIDFHSSQVIDIVDRSEVVFPKLQKFEIVSMLHLEECRDARECDFPCLLEITVKDCPRMVALMTQVGIRSLTYLEVNNCPMLESLPGGDLSIGTLVIDRCPLLSSNCLKEESQDWSKIRCIPSVFIDQIELQ